MTVVEFDQRLAQYVQSVLIPECKTTWRKFVLGAAIGSGKLSVRTIPQGFMTTVGAIDANDNIDVDLLKRAALGGVEAAGELYIEFIGLHFTKADLEKFFNFVEKGVVG